MADVSHIPGLIARPLLFALYGISGMIRRDPRIWAFGSWSGQRYADNSAALFEYVAGLQDSDISPVWISHDRTIVARLRDQGFEAYHAWSLGGLWATARSGILIYDGLTKDINHWVSRGAKRVLLRHGIGIKNIERAIDNKNHRLYKLFYGNGLQRLFWHVLIPWHNLRPDLSIATSKDHATQGGQYFGIGSDRIVITGFPRNDRLVSPGTEIADREISAVIARARATDKPVWLYMPTFRDDDSRFPMPLAQLTELATELNIMLLIKLHFVDAKRNSFSQRENTDSFHSVDPRLDAQVLYPVVDGLISDYSSSPFDFILTGNPVILFTPDMEEYQKYSRSFYYDFDEIRPGPRVSTLGELKEVLLIAIEQGNAVCQPEYDRALKRFHQYRDSGSCQRTFTTIYQRFVSQDDD